MSENFAAELHRRATTALQAGRADAQGEGERVPVSQYTDEAIARDERRLLLRHPQPVAASASLASPGAWLSLTHTDVPLLLVRQESGQVQAFLNVCRHRGARVVPEGSGSEARAFVCPYHAWTYKPDGALRGVPESFGFPCLKQDESGLRRLATVERAGVVWVVCEPSQADSDPGANLGALMDNLESLAGLRAPVAYAPRTYEVAANWKLLVDGSFEAYHFKVAHRETIAPMFLHNLQIVDEFDLNRRLYLLKSKFQEHRPDAAGFDPRRYGNLTYFFFPNTTILVQPDHAQLSMLEPLGATRTRVHELTLIPEAPASEKATAHWDANVALYRRTLAEDYALAESIQAGLASGANDALNFGTFEYSAPRFHAQLAHQVAAMPAAR
ncbi:aromatic ring-hydroxylating oxygenase subunit alpha [Variovorax sp. Root473]|uniref:aromatic ring-hydroxylating oxygenase subunit alpha n=1 Tax=Variovorax sp. Root473 TaxID=1736541 RepID=UPI0006F5EFA6|nr:SRPBCC family protein [Variovorax sp. Root473]KQX96230.1 (2Fe-2S)-binding protein [Variovorax sp. Root473]